MVSATIGLVSLNEENTIARALGALVEEGRRTNSEVIVVAGGSDRTATIAEGMLKGVPDARFLLDSEPRGKPAALNRMFSCATGPIFVLSDGDVEVRPGSVELLLNAMKPADVGAASGRVVGITGEYNIIEKACDLMTEMMHLSRMESFKCSGTLELATGYLYGIKKEMIRTVPEDMNSDDGYLSLTVRSKGKRIAYVPDAVVAIRFPGTLSDFIRQKMRTRMGHLQLKAEFPGLSPRTAAMEMREYRLLSKAARSRGYGPAVSILALLLTALAWSAAHIRKHLPWLFKKKAWQPISSTKSTRTS